MKSCFRCKQIKPLSEYHKHPQKKDGFNPSCKACLNLRNSGYYIKNKEHIKEKNSQYYHNNKEKQIASQKKRNAIRRQTDHSYVLARRLRNRLYYALKKKNWKKDTHFFQYIGCSLEELKTHIEKQFKPGMSWDNRHEFHIDHIIPLSSAKTEEEMYKLCHYTNLQPMWPKENIRKGTKILGANRKDYTIKPIDYTQASLLIKKHHYSKKSPNSSYYFGLFKQDLLVGVCTFAKPSSQYVANYISTNPELVLELNRLALVNNIKNEASILVSSALKLLPKNTIVVSFADTKQKHIGYIYQACNFKYFGTTLAKREFQAPNTNLHSSTLAKDPKKYGAVLGDRSLKHRYIYSKNYSSIKLKELPYPKK